MPRARSIDSVTGVVRSHESRAARSPNFTIDEQTGFLSLESAVRRDRWFLYQSRSGARVDETLRERGVPIAQLRRRLSNGSHITVVHPAKFMDAAFWSGGAAFVNAASDAFDAYGVRDAPDYEISDITDDTVAAEQVLDSTRFRRLERDLRSAPRRAVNAIRAYALAAWLDPRETATAVLAHLLGANVDAETNISDDDGDDGEIHERGVRAAR